MMNLGGLGKKTVKYGVFLDFMVINLVLFL